MVFSVRGVALLFVFTLLASCGGNGKRHAADIDARQSSAEGVAVIGDQGLATARQEAIDAATLEASQRMTSSDGAAQRVSNIKVVEEWQEGNEYHVQILAILSDKAICKSQYRKKIVATAFPIMNADQLSSTESQDLFGGIPREINNRLMERGDFIGRNLTNIVLYSRPDLAPSILPSSDYSGSSIINTARQQDAQFVLSGVIRDFKIESTEYVRGSGIFAEIKSMVRDMVARRSIGIDVYVHDGLTGALLFQQRYTDSILGDVSLPAGYTVGSERFDSTPAGHKIQQIIHMASDDIHRFLACYPFASRVTQISGNTIVIAAGAQDKIRPGDKFKIYPAVNLNGAPIPESQGELTITQVGATSAQGVLNAGAQALSVHPGDWVKSSAGQ